MDEKQELMESCERLKQLFERLKKQYETRAADGASIHQFHHLGGLIVNNANLAQDFIKKDWMDHARRCHRQSKQATGELAIFVANHLKDVTES